MQSPDALNKPQNSLRQNILNHHWVKSGRRAWQWVTRVHSNDPLQHTLNSAFANILVVIFMGSFFLIPLGIAVREPLVVIVSTISLPFYILIWWLNRKGTIFGGLLIVAWMIFTLAAGLIPASYTGIDSPVPLVLIFPVLMAALFIRPQAALWTVFALMSTLAVRLSMSDVPPENQVRFLLIGTENLSAFALILWIGTRIFLQALRVAIASNEALSVLNIRLKQEIQQRIDAENQLLESQRKQLELESQKALIDFKQQFIATVSHDFRTPLAVIKTSSDLIEHYHDRLTPEDRMRHIRGVQTQVQHMVELMDEVLIIHESQSNKMMFNPALLDMKAFCEELYAEFKVTLTERHLLSFTNELPDKAVLVDEKLLRHILTNLLSNAIKYSPQGGKIQFSATAQEGMMRFTVSDEGLGIEAEEKDRLFDPFHRGKNVGRIPGSGLGLSIVKSAVERHGGTIGYTSTLNKGTTFEVKLPILAA